MVDHGALIARRGAESDLFEYIGTYFVDVIFNHMHTAARTRCNQGSSSLTTAYQEVVAVYVAEVKHNPQSYRNMVNNLHGYVREFNRLRYTSYPKFIEMVVYEIVPAEYHGELTPKRQDEYFNIVICDLIASLAATATSPEMLSKIIDHHDTHARIIIQMLQNHAVDALVGTRDRIRNEFVRAQGQAKRHSNDETIERLKDALRRVVKEKIAAEQERDSALEELRDEKRKRRVDRTKFERMLVAMRAKMFSGELQAPQARRPSPDEEIPVPDADIPTTASLPPDPAPGPSSPNAWTPARAATNIAPVPGFGVQDVDLSI